MEVIDIHFLDGQTWEVYVAASQVQRNLGLSNVSHLDLAGMLFSYESPSYAPFTMKNMAIDLSIAWYDRSGMLLDLRTFASGYQSAIFAVKPYYYVLEAPVNTIPFCNLRMTK